MEVKGRAGGAETVTVTRNEVLTALNAPDACILTVVESADDFAAQPRYVRSLFAREPDFGATSMTDRLDELIGRSGSSR